MGVDDGGNGIGRVVEPVYELKAECDQQRQSEEAVGRVTGDRRGIEIVGYMKNNVDDTRGEHCEKCKNAGFARLSLELAVEE